MIACSLQCCHLWSEVIHCLTSCSLNWDNLSCKGHCNQHTMAEQNAPKGEPYGLAVACLHQYSATLPACIVIHPDHVLWPHSSEGLSLQTFQLLEPASAVLSAVKAQAIPLALLVSAPHAGLIHSCLEQANLLGQFAAMVQYQPDDIQQQQQQTEQRPAQQQRPSQNSSWAEAANSLKAQIGAPWQQCLFFSADPLAIRQANRLGMAAVKVSSGLGVSSLQAGLEIYSSKLESDRGY